jgi:hypothetical protein
MSTDDNTPPARSPYVTDRLRYFNAEFLDTKAFTDEQDYHVDRQARHESALHVFGILEGLVVTATGVNAVQITQGSALDEDGNQILLWGASAGSKDFAIDTQEAITLNWSAPPEGASAAQIFTFSGLPSGNIYYVDVLFVETPGGDYQGKDATRWVQDPANVLSIGTRQRDKSVLIAKVTVSTDPTSGNTSIAVDTGAVPYAGLRLPWPSGDQATLRVANKNTNPDDDPSFQVILDKPLFLKRPSSGNDTHLEIDRGALIFLNTPGDIWAHDYSQRILLQNGAVELRGKNHVILSGGSNGDATYSLVAHESGDIGIGLGAVTTNASTDNVPAARLEIKAASGKAGLQVTSSSSTSALLKVQDSGTTVSGALTAQSGITISNGGLTIQGGGITAPSGGLSVSGGLLTANDGLTVKSTLTLQGGVVVWSTQTSPPQAADMSLPSQGLSMHGGPVTVSGGTLTASSGLTASNGLTVSGGGLTVSGGNVTISGGNVAVNNGHTLTVAGALTAQGGLTLTGNSAVLGAWTNGSELSSDGSSLTFTTSGSKTVTSKTTMATDGFLVVQIYQSSTSSDTRGYVEVRTGSSTTNLKRVGRASMHDRTNGETVVQDNTVTIPVRKGEYWQVYAAATQNTIGIEGHWFAFGG